MSENLTTPDRKIERAVLEIRETESELAQIVDEIQRKLTLDSIERLAWQQVRKRLLGGIEAMTDKGLKEMNQNIGKGTVETVKNHPVSTAMLGLGVGLLMAEGWRRRYGKQASEQQPAIVEYPAESSIPEYQEEVSAMPYTESYEGQAEQAVSGTRMSRIKTAAVQKTKYARERVSSVIDERPLLVGIIGLTAGMIIGAVTSGVFRDNEFLQEKRQDLKQKTRDLLREEKEKAQHVLSDAKRAIKEAAERENLITH